MDWLNGRLNPAEEWIRNFPNAARRGREIETMKERLSDWSPQ